MSFRDAAHNCILFRALEKETGHDFTRHPLPPVGGMCKRCGVSCLVVLDDYRAGKNPTCPNKSDEGVTSAG